MEKLKPKEAIRAYCTQCLGMKQFNTDQVSDCQGDHVKCPFFPYRMGKRLPVKVFRAFCIDCMGGYRDSATNCTTRDCPNHPYRLGTNPAREGSQLRGIALRNKSDKEGVVRAFRDPKPVFSH